MRSRYFQCIRLKIRKSVETWGFGNILKTSLLVVLKLMRNIKTEK